MCETALGAAILIHHSFEGSDKLSYGCLFQGKVSIRAPARGATRGRGCGRWYRHISIRAPARGATPPTWTTKRADAVSIRAPARGATAHRPLLQIKRPVSIRAPARGATQRPRHGGRDTCRFNSRSREGSDDNGGKMRGSNVVSIRAPARGATTTAARCAAAMLFQFALPRGERRAAVCL